MLELLLEELLDGLLLLEEFEELEELLDGLLLLDELDELLLELLDGLLLVFEVLLEDG